MEVALVEGGRDARFLAELAEPLEPRRPPFYVKNAGGSADGWYWVPTGASRAQWLGRNVIWTQRQLMKLRREHEQAA